MGAFARTVLIAFYLGERVPPQVFGFVVSVDDGVRQAIFAVEVFGFVAQRIGFGNQQAFGVVTGLPHAAIGETGFGDQRSGQMVLVTDRAPQRVGFFDQPGEVVVLERQAVAVGQADADQVADLIEIHGVAFATKVAAGDDPVVGVVVNLQLAAKHVGGPTGALLEVIAEMIVFAVAGPVLDHPRLTVLGFPAVLAGQAEGVAVAGHDSVVIAEVTHGIAVAVDHFGQLAVVVVAVLHQGFDRDLFDNALDVSQTPKGVVVV
ncbi:hypothetical protein D3C78_1163000 [compost metagenome]